MQLKQKKYLLDILNSISEINSFILDTHNFEEYSKNIILKRAIERELEIIGEAINKLLQFDNSIKISNSKKIISLRNYIIHSYDSVDDSIIWGVTKKHIPILKEEIKKLINGE